MAELLLLHGAHPFLSTTLRDSLAYGGAAQRGCYSAIAVAGAHGQRTMLHLLLSHPITKSNKDVLSLEEILAEGASQLTCDRRTSRLQVPNFYLKTLHVFFFSIKVSYATISFLTKEF